MSTEELSQLALERDLARSQAEQSKADLMVARMALEENRPLEALRTINQAIDRLDEELETLEEIGEAREADDAE